MSPTVGNTKASITCPARDGPVTIIAVLIVIISSISELDSSWSHISHSRIESSFCLSLSLGQARPERDGSEIQRKGAGGGGIQETLATGTASLSLSLPIFFSLQFVSLSFRPISCSHLLSYYSDRSMFPWGFGRIGSQDQGVTLGDGFQADSRGAQGSPEGPPYVLQRRYLGFRCFPSTILLLLLFPTY